MALPPIFIGAAGSLVNWDEIPEFVESGQELNPASILPLCLKYLCPAAVGYIGKCHVRSLVHSHKHHQDTNFFINISGLASVAAAVMSSADSSLLSASSVLTVNTTRKLLDRFNVSFAC